jgi:hypothetical protein
MSEFEKNQNQGKTSQDQQNEKPAFGQLAEKGQQQGEQEFGRDKQEELTGAEGKTGETKGQAGQQSQDFAKGGQGATGDARQQQQDQGQSKGQQGQGWQDKNDQQR